MSDLDKDGAQVNLPLDSRYGRGGIDGALARFGEQTAREQRAAERAAARERRAHRDRVRALLPPTPEQLRGATRVLVLQSGCWHLVRKVNRVTVETHGWGRVRLDQIEAWAGPVIGLHYRHGDERQETP